MRAPAFWWAREPDFRAAALAPLAALYGAIAARRMAGKGVAVDAPVICIGNFVAGGAGKTPTALAVARVLRQLGERPFFLSRGYGASRAHHTPLRVDFERHDAGQVGDEPLLLGREAPTIVCADRIAGAQACVRAGASVIVMDDGLQNPALLKDLAIAVIDAGAGVGNGLCIPAGPLRAPLEAQFAHIDAVMLIGSQNLGFGLGQAVADEARAHSIPTLTGFLAPDPQQAAYLCDRSVVAFAGIGRPEKFFETLRQTGALLAASHAFADHHVYTKTELEHLRAEARNANALLVTTAKDHVRMGAPSDVQALDLHVLDVALAPDEPGDLEDLLTQGLARARRR
jgi:tetraacyldisaccharide 4'-kinase